MGDMSEDVLSKKFKDAKLKRPGKWALATTRGSWHVVVVGTLTFILRLPRARPQPLERLKAIRTSLS